LLSAISFEAGRDVFYVADGNSHYIHSLAAAVMAPRSLVGAFPGLSALAAFSGLFGPAFYGLGVP
jgi:hypothetical protein